MRCRSIKVSILGIRLLVIHNNTWSCSITLPKRIITLVVIVHVLQNHEFITQRRNTRSTARNILYQVFRSCIFVWCLHFSTRSAGWTDGLRVVVEAVGRWTFNIFRLWFRVLFRNVVFLLAYWLFRITFLLLPLTIVLRNFRYLLVEIRCHRVTKDVKFWQLFTVIIKFLCVFVGVSQWRLRQAHLRFVEFGIEIFWKLFFDNLDLILLTIFWLKII